MKPDQWVWMPHPGHFICGDQCRFVLNTYVGGYIVSTVGEYKPDSAVQAITGRTGFEDLGFNRKYETMVFNARKAKKSEGLCCPWRMASAQETDMAGYNDPVKAREGHIRLCKKWAQS